ncbi:MAG: sigma-70 family RNA polymerase sigma factor [Phycisphaerales bacterium]|nr:MAG: sigma-70 family RNA polymerase sigma factor [Phycisphaerales bacterium]
MALAHQFDADLPVVEALQQGDPYALDELMRRHGGWVRGVAYGVLGDPSRVDDVCQQAWTAVWEQARRLREPSRWKAWVYRLVRNAAIDAGRDKRRARKTVQELAESALAGRPPREPARPDEVLSEAEQREAMRQAIRSLPAIYREPFVLRHMEGWSYRRIAEVMGLPADTVETRLVRARRLLREMLRGKV